jgi:hypothetical protein
MGSPLRESTAEVKIAPPGGEINGAHGGNRPSRDQH